MAYSASFGFSVPTGNESLEEIGGDSTLALTDDGGETWRVRRETLDARFENGWLKSNWKPWADVEVETWLLPPTEKNKAWHVRAHKIKTGRNLRSAEGGWAIYGQREDGRALEDFPGAKEQTHGKEEKEGSALAKSDAGVSGVVDLSPVVKREGKAVRLDANSNLIFARSVLPTLIGEHKAGEEVVLYTAVLGIPVRKGQDGVRTGWIGEWESMPEIIEGLKSSVEGK